MALAPVLQIRAIRSAGHSGSVSVGYQAILIVGFVLWLAYGIALDNLAIIVPNTIAAVVSVTTILVARHYRGREASRAEDEEPAAISSTL